MSGLATAVTATASLRSRARDRLIRSDEAAVRTAALDALRVMPQALATHLSALLRDPDADVRLLACDLARELPQPLATRLLCDLLATEQEVNVCGAAVLVRSRLACRIPQF